MISSTRDSVDETGVGRVGFDLDPQPAHQLGKTVIPDTFFVDSILWPDRFDQLVLLAYFPCVFL
jgi:hypothetical protein